MFPCTKTTSSALAQRRLSTSVAFAQPLYLRLDGEGEETFVNGQKLPQYSSIVNHSES